MDKRSKTILITIIVSLVILCLMGFISESSYKNGFSDGRESGYYTGYNDAQDGKPFMETVE